MVMQDKVTLGGIDVTDYRITWDSDEQWQQAIDSLNITFTAQIKDLFTEIIPGMEITVQRGFTTSTDEYVMTGQVTQVKPTAARVALVCKGQMYDAVKSAQIKSWDRNIDTEAGIGSEIFKTICDNSGLLYSSTSIPTTGTSEAQLIEKFVQNDEDDFQKMNELADVYDRVITYDYDNQLVNFKPKGYTTYGTSLTVGLEIPAQINWKENMEQMVNKLKVKGATVYDKIVETFAGPASEFSLSKTPEDTEVRINHATTNDLQTRGQKDIGTIGTDFDYYMDVENKKLVFGSDVSDVWINYGAQVPMPLTLSDTFSIEKYGGPNKKPHFKTMTFNDIKDVKDAELRGRAILSKYSTPFLIAKSVPIKNSVLETYGTIRPGSLVQIIDPYTDKDVTVFVQGVKKSWPHVVDKIEVGDEIWRTVDWQNTQMKKINQLFNELNKNADILIEAFDYPNDVYSEGRYFELQRLDRSSDGVNVFILGSDDFGVLGTQELGDSATVPVTIQLVQANNTYKEFLYDEDFHYVPTTPTVQYLFDETSGTTAADNIGSNDATLQYSGNSATDGLIGYWPLENGTADDETANANDGTLSTATIIDDLDATTGWTNATLNSTNFLYGTGALSMNGGFTGWRTMDKTISSTNLSNRIVTVHVYFESQTVIDNLNGSKSIEFSYGTDSSNRYKYSFSETDMHVGWNVLRVDIDNPNETSIGTPPATSNITWIRLAINSTVAFSTGAVVFDYIQYGAPVKTKDHLGNENGALLFSNTTDMFSVSDATITNTMTQLGTYTIGCWVKQMAEGTNMNIWNYSESGSNRHNLNFDGSSIGFQRYNGTSYTGIRATTATEVGEWIRIICVSNAGVLTLYKNGVSIGSSGNNYAVAANDTTFRIGYPGNATNGSKSIDGAISEFFIERGKAWSAIEAADDYANNSIHKWNDPIDTTDNNAIRVNGLTQYNMTSAVTLSRTSSAITWNMYVTQNLIDYGNVYFGNTWLGGNPHITSNSSYFYYETNTNNDGWQWPKANVFTSIGWHHFAMTWTNSVVTLYVDGVEISGGSATAAGITNDMNVKLIGDQGFGYTYGEIIEFKIKDVRLFPSNSLAEEDVMLLSQGKEATWNTITKQLEFSGNDVILTKKISLGTQYSYFTVTMPSVTGSVTTEISGDNGTTWQTVTLGARTAFTSSDTSGVLLRITETAGTTAVIANTYKTGGAYNLAGVKVKLEE